MANVFGPIGIIDSVSTYSLAFDDQNDTTANTWMLNNSDAGVSGLASISVFFGVTTSYLPGQLNSLTINGGSGGNTFNVNNTTSFVPTTLNTGLLNDTVNVFATGDNILNINGQGGPDAVILGALASPIGMQDLNGTINVGNESGISTLILDDSMDTTGQTASLLDNGANGSVNGLSPAAINYTDANTRQLSIMGGSGGNTFNVNGTLPDSFGPEGSMVLDTGSGSSNLVNVLATNPNGFLWISGAGTHNAVVVGNNGSIANIASPVVIEGSTASTALTIDSANDTLPHALDLSKEGPYSVVQDNLENLPGEIVYITASLTSLTINTNGAEDQSLNVNFDGANPIPAGAGTPGLFFNAGAPAAGVSHALTISGELQTGPFAGEIHNANDPAVGPANGQYGSIYFNDGTDSPTAITGLWYTGLQPITDTAAVTNFVFNDFAADNSFAAPMDHRRGTQTRSSSRTLRPRVRPHSKRRTSPTRTMSPSTPPPTPTCLAWSTSRRPRPDCRP